MICVPKGAWELMKTLESRGWEAYVVGGCVRDALLGKTPHDWDICTSAPPQETLAAFRELTVIPTGLQHGTVTVLYEGEPFEITTYRVDGDYSDGRHPDRVAFTGSLEEDLSRRDFTVNAMAYHPRRGIRDPFGGQADLRAKIIRCVGNPDCRFGEDALRILRALRFSACLGFAIEGNTAESLLQSRRLLERIAAERIRAELDRLLGGREAAAVLRRFRPVMEVFLPELAPMARTPQRHPYHLWDVYEHTLRAVDAVPPGEERPLIRLAVLLHDMGKPACHTRDEKGVDHFHGHPAVSEEMAGEVLRRLKYDNHTRDAVKQLVRFHDYPIEPPERAARRILCRLGEAQARRLLAVKRADRAGQRPCPPAEARLDAFAQALEEAIARGQAFSLKNLAVDGRQLIAAGVEPGPAIGEILRRLLEEVVEDPGKNDRELLLGEALSLWGQMQTQAPLPRE